MPYPLENNNTMPFEEFQRIATGSGNKLSFDEFKQIAEQDKPKPSSMQEWAKAGGRAFLEPGNMINRAIESGSNRIGQAFGVAPENNPISQWQRDVVRAGEGMQSNDLGKNQEWAGQHPVQNFVQEQVEGALPYVQIGMVPGGHLALPAIASASTDAKLTNKLIDQGQSSSEAMSKSWQPAALEGGMFAAMGGAKNLVMGGLSAEGNFVKGKAVDLLGKRLTNNPIVGDLTKAATPLQAIGREAAFVAPYLHTQGEATQAAELASGASSIEEYQKQHGYDSSQGFATNAGNVALNQLKGLGTSALVGAGFGIPTALGIRSQAKKLGIQDDIKEKIQQEAASKVNNVVEAQQTDLTNRNISSDLTGKAPTLDEQVRVKQDVDKVEVIKQEAADNLGVMDTIERANSLREQADAAHKAGDIDSAMRLGADSEEMLSRLNEEEKSLDLSPKLNSYVSESSSLASAKKQSKEQANSVDSGFSTGSKGIIENGENGVKQLNEENEKAEYHDKLQEDAQHPTIQSVTNLINTVNSERGSAPVAPEYMVNAVKKIHASVKNVKEFTAELVKRFGESIKQHAIKLWNFAKQSASWAKSKLKDDRGLVGLDIDATEYVNHSGGAKGADTEWDVAGKEHGFNANRHYRPEHLDSLKESEINEIESAYQKAVKDLGRNSLPKDSYAGKLVRRDYLQAKNADEVFAVSHLLKSGEKDKKGYVNKTGKTVVEGGTGYAVQMAINLGKHAYVYDQVRKSWYKYNKEDGLWHSIETPILSKNYAGIGTREINENGKQAIRDVFKKTSEQPVVSLEEKKIQVKPNTTRITKAEKDALGQQAQERVLSARKELTKEDFQNNEVLSPDNNQDRSAFHKEQFEMQKWLDRKSNWEEYQKSLDDNPNETPEQFYKRVRKGEKIDEHDTAADLFDSELYNKERDDYNDSDYQTDRVRRQGYDNSLKRVLDEYDSIASSAGAVSSSERKLGSKESAVEDYNKKTEQKINQLVLQMMANKRLNSDNVEFKGFSNLSMTEYAKRLLKEMTRYDADGKRLDIDAVIRHIEKKDGKPSEWKEYPQSLFDLERYLVGLKTKDGVEPALKSERTKSYIEEEAAQVADKSIANTIAKSNKPIVEAVRSVARTVENPKSFAIKNALALKEIVKDPQGFIESFDHHIEQAKRGKETDVSGVLDNKKDIAEIRSLLEDYYDPDAKKDIVFTDEFIKHFGKNIDNLREDVPDTGDIAGPIEKERMDVLANAGDKSIRTTGKAKEERLPTLTEKQRTEAQYKSWKEIAGNKMKGVMDIHGTLADFFDAVLATKKNSKGDFMLDHKDISDRLAEKNPKFAEKTEEERLALVQKLFDATTIENGTWESKVNREGAAYTGVSENIDAKRDVTQLGEESEKYTADQTSDNKGAQLKLLHIRGKELMKYDVPDNLEGIISKSETLGLLSESDTKQIDGLIEKLNNGNPIQKSSAKRELFNLTTRYKVMLAKKAIENASVVNPKFFEKQAADNPEIGLSAAEHYRLFMEAGGDKSIYLSRVRKEVADAYQNKADELAKTFTKDNRPEDVRKALTERFDDSQKKAYESFVSDGETKDLPINDKLLFQATRRAENEVAALGYENASPSTTKFEYQVQPNVEDYFTHKAPDAFEKTLGVTTGKFRNKVVQKFYDLISKAFDADLVIISDPEYKSRYKFDEVSKRGKLIINVAHKVSFARMFAHELFHHVVRKALPEEYKAFTDAMDKFVKDKELFKNYGSEEVYANVFEETVTSKAFYESLSETAFGNGLASKIISRLIQNTYKLSESLRSDRPFSYESNVLIDRADMDSVHALIGDLLGKAYKSTRYNTDMSNEMFWTDIKEHINNGKGFASDKLNQAFPEKTRKGIFESIGKLADNALQWIKEKKPKGIFADFMSDPEQIRLASKVMHGLEYETAKAYHGVVAKHADAWKGMNNEQLEGLHDKIVRGNVNVLTSEGELRAKSLGLTNGQITCLKEYKRVSDELHGKLSEIYPDLMKRESHYGQSIRWFKKKGTILDDSFDWAVNPEFSKLEGSKHYLKEKDENRTTREIAEQHELEYNTVNPHDLFIQYVREANKLLKLNEMVKEGQEIDAIRTFTNDFAAVKEGYVPISDNSSKVFQKLNPATGFKILTGDGYYEREGHEVVYNSEKDAHADMKRYGLEGDVEAIKPEKDNKSTHWSVMKMVSTKGEDGKPHTEKSEIRSFGFDKENEALAFAEKQPKDSGVSYKLERVEAKNDNAIASRMYFKPDLARMINVVLAPDRLRNGSFFGVTGRDVMNVKNTFSTIEFAGSLFHAMTIGQETVASTSGWAAQRYGKYNVAGTNNLGKKVSGYNPVKAVKDAKDMDAIFKAILSNEDLAKNTAIQKKMDELLGTHNADVLDVLRQFFNAGGIMHMDESLKGGIHEHAFKYTKGNNDVSINGDNLFIGKQKISVDEMKQSIKEAWEKELADNGKLKGTLNASAFTVLKPMTQWLMEDGIPKIKMAAFAREYTLKVDKNTEKIKTGEVTKEELARDTMKFIDDRFGEVNWKNMWMDPSIKTGLQFAFRSFTWFTGSWKALGKAGADIARAGFVTAKGGKFELTEKGLWGINAMLAHALTAGLITAAYQLFNTATGTQETPTDEDTPTLTKALFPRIDPYDPSKRVSIPSYVTEGYKIMSHVGFTGNKAEPSKLVSGRFNSILGKGLEIWNNEDFRGVTIHNRDDSYTKQAMDMAVHMAPMPIFLSSILSDRRDRGFNASTAAMSFLGATDAPASAKRSSATNAAFEQRREEYKGKAITPEQMDEKDVLKRAMYAYQTGDKTKIDSLLHEGKISKRQYDIAMTRVPLIKGQPNPKFKDPLSQAISGLTMDGAIKVWSKMSDNEKKKHKGEMMKKYINMNARQDKSPEDKIVVKNKLKELGLI